MKSNYTLQLDDPRAELDLVGGKGASLARMARQGLPVPNGYYINTAAYREFVDSNNLLPGILEALQGTDPVQLESLEKASALINKRFLNAPIPPAIAQEIIQAYSHLPGMDPAVAVRSSATAEDLPEASFAGQQDTYLNISGGDALLDAVRKCWGSLWTARAISYRARQGISPESVALAVVVQLLVPAEAAGIMFTANPLNGSQDQIIINASWGLGEAVVSGLVTPDTIVMEKPSRKMIDYQIAEKLVRTVRAEGSTRQEAVPGNLRKVPVLNDGQASELAGLGQQIEDLYERPMDIEWTLADGEFAVVQARPITALADPEPQVPGEWKLPRGAYAAMRNNIVELMADPLTPLFKTMGLQAVNASMDRIMTGFLGDAKVLPDDPIIVVNEYAYYNGSVRFGPIFKIILDTGGILKRMLTGAVERWTEDGLPQYRAVVGEWEKKPWRTYPALEILAACRLLAEAAIDAYMALVSGVLPAAWMSEAWFTFSYKFIKRRSDPDAPVYLMGFESLPIQAEKSLYDLAGLVREEKDLASYLTGVESAALWDQMKTDQLPEGINPEAWQEWREKFQAYLDQYGHAIYNLDFGNPVPADDPAPVLETFQLFLRGEGTDPHLRQGQSARRREQAELRLQGRLKGRRLKSFQKKLARAQKFSPLREDGLADVGLSYPLLRSMLRELGARFREGGMIAEIDHVFWLEGEEAAEAAARLDRGEALEDLSGLVLQRKAVWRAARRAAAPMMLPQIKIFGRDLMALKGGGLKGRKAGTLKGVAASPGLVTAPACVLHGPEDFNKMNTGDILVASLTTPAWTPLFARASAVVTDIGGPLSHGSIVAREYGIPAVLGTNAATARISSGQIITVDGDKGTVLLEAPAA